MFSSTIAQILFDTVMSFFKDLVTGLVLGAAGLSE